MQSCQICGRYPAKRVSFKAHQGFLLFRREIALEGILCRDHALEAYFAARGATLKGMWFSTGSLLFGTIRSLWDSAKLLDLPDEVQDEPWVLHVVACPNCHYKNVAPAGSVVCSHCGRLFSIASCRACSTVHAMDAPASIGTLELRCRKCGQFSHGANAIRNSPILLTARAIAEVAASIASVHGTIRDSERDLFRDTIRSLFSFDASTNAYLDKYFEICGEGRSQEVWRTFPQNSHTDVIRLLVHTAVLIAQADGQIDEAEKARLEQIARCLGIDPASVLDTAYRQTQAQTSGPWWIVLGVSRDASLEEVTFAYRKLAVKFHPDLWARASPDMKTASEKQMKLVNTAFEQAKQFIYSRQGASASAQPSASCSPSRPQEPRWDETAAEKQSPATDDSAGEREQRSPQRAPSDSTASAGPVQESQGKPEPQTVQPSSTPSKATPSTWVAAALIAVSLLVCITIVVVSVPNAPNMRTSDTSRGSDSAPAARNSATQDSGHAHWRSDRDHRQESGPSAVPANQSTQEPEPDGTRRQIVALFSVRQDVSEGAGTFSRPVSQARLELYYRAESRSETVLLGNGISDERGTVRISAWLIPEQQDRGQFSVKVSWGDYLSLESMPDFLRQPSWEIRIPYNAAPGSSTFTPRNPPLPGDLRSIPAAPVAQHSERIPKNLLGKRPVTSVAASQYPMLLARYTEQIESFAASRTTNPEESRLRVERGILLCKLYRFSEAEYDFTYAIRLRPDYAKAYHNRGVCRILQRKALLAIPDFDAAIRLDPTYAAAYANRALAHQETGDEAKASSDYGTARRLGFEPTIE